MDRSKKKFKKIKKMKQKRKALANSGRGQGTSAFAPCSSDEGRTRVGGNPPAAVASITWMAPDRALQD